MPIVQTKWSRRLAVTLCAMLLILTAIPISASADSVHIDTAWQEIMYFDKYNNGVWGDLGTPPHTVRETGQAAYCLQMTMDSSYGDGYTSTNGSKIYSQKVLNGLKAILEYGYPASNGGFTDNEAQYATANAIRFYLAENGDADMFPYMKNTRNVRAKPGYEALYNWCLELLEHGRHPETNRSISFSQTDLTLEFKESAFEGDVKVTLKNLNSGYTLDSSALPEGASVTGFTGKSGDTLHISIPEEYEESAFTLTATGSNQSSQAVLFFYAPTVAGQQRVVTCNYDLASDQVSASMTVRTPEGPNYGFISIQKMDSETGASMPGVLFRVYDADGAVVADGYTDASGVFTTGKLPLGEYSIKEILGLLGYRLDETAYPVSLVKRKETVTVTVKNDPRKAALHIFKRDAAGSPLANAAFALESSTDGGVTWSAVTTRSSGADGRLSFTELPANDGTVYRLTEINAAPGKMLSGETVFLGKLPLQYSAALATDGKDYEIVGDTAYLYELSFTVCDAAIPELPFTGSGGLTILSLASMLLVCLGAFFISKSKKMGVIDH